MKISFLTEVCLISGTKSLEQKEDFLKIRGSSDIKQKHSELVTFGWK
jgi:hypothetical protein